MTPPLGLLKTDVKVSDEYREVCKVDEDCPYSEEGQVCTFFLWDVVKDGSSFANGSACYNWNVEVCPGPPFANSYSKNRMTQHSAWEPNLTQTEFFVHPSQGYEGGRSSIWPSLDIMKTW